MTEEPEDDLLSDQSEFECDAFPAGIPEAIQAGDLDHTQAFPGAHALRYHLEAEKKATDRETPLRR